MKKPILFNTEMVKEILEGRKTTTRRQLKQPFEVHPNGFITKAKGNERLIPYDPPYKYGDILYVRETWLKGDDGYHYKANSTLSSEEVRREFGYKWKPSIHMPKVAARILLKVISIRVERIQDITEDGARKEGCFLPSYKDSELIGDSVTLFKVLWNKLYENWNDNPYVWVLEFEVIKK